MILNSRKRHCWLTVAVACCLFEAAAQDRQTLLQRAEQDYSGGRYTAAEGTLTNVLKQKPDDYAANELMGLVLSAEGQDTRATLPFTRAVQADPQSIAARENLATNYAKLGKKNLAENELLRLAASDPQNFGVLHNIGEFYAQQGELAAAVPWLRRAHKVDPANYDNGYDLALGLIATGQLNEAEACVRSMLAARESAELHSLLADAYEKDGKFLAAGSEYQRAAQMDPSEDTVFDWGAELLRHRNLPEAQQVLSRGITMFPHSARMVIGLGLVKHLSGEEADAVRAILQAAAINPDDARSYYFLASLERIPPDLRTEVTQRFRMYADRHPERADAQYYYAANLWSMNEASDSAGDEVTIEARLKRALLLNPAFYDAHNLLGVMFQERGQYAPAVQEFEAAIREKPTLQDAHYRLALLLYKLGKKQKADEEMQEFRKLRAADKEDRILSFLLSR